MKDQFAIVVLDNGFVYVGYATFTGSEGILREARNIERYGTTEGLGL